MIHNIVNVVLNTLLVSIPEEAVWVVLTLIFLKRFDLLDRYRWKESIRIIMIPVLSVAISNNIFRYILDIPRVTIFFLSSIIMYSLIIYIIKKNTFLEEKSLYLKTLLFAFLACVIIGITETLYTPIVLHYINMTISQVNDNILLNFLISFPSRVLQILIVYVLWFKCQNGINIFKNIILDKKILITTLGFLLAILVIMFILIKLIFDSNFLIINSIYIQGIVGMLLFSIPPVLMLIYITPINHLFNRINKINQSHQNELDILDSDN